MLSLVLVGVIGVLAVVVVVFGIPPVDVVVSDSSDLSGVLLGGGEEGARERFLSFRGLFFSWPEPD